MDKVSLFTLILPNTRRETTEGEITVYETLEKKKKRKEKRKKENA